MYSENLLDTILDTVQDMIVIADKNNAILRINHAFKEFSGESEAAVMGRNAMYMGMDCNESSLFNNLTASLQRGDDWQGEMFKRRHDGEVKRFNVVVRTIRDAGGVLLYRMSVLQNLTWQESSKEKSHDQLTNIPNLRLFKDRAAQALIAARRAGQLVALLHLGLDRFTLVNDGLGHAYGDLVLKEVANRLEEGIRRSDTLARLGGDQFALIMPVAVVNHAVIVAEKCLQRLNKPYLIENEQVVMTASIGISLFPTDGEETEGLIKSADSAMRHAKKRGGNRYLFFSSEMNQRAKQRLVLENNLRRALVNKEFVLYYQPKIGVKDNAIVGAEALVRWIDPERGLILPDEFIPVAEESALIVPLGEWILRQACTHSRLWQQRGFSPLRLSVNVAAPQFHSPDLVAVVDGILKETGLKPELLELEITESMLMGDIEKTIEKLHDLRKLGVGLSIDDFGTGYSSLSYLSRFPLTTLKIDRAFIKDIENNQSSNEIARAIISLSRGLQLDVVAEGAENQGHIDFLREQGCTTVQGFFYSRPVPEKAFAKLLAVGYIRPESP